MFFSPIEFEGKWGNVSIVKLTGSGASVTPAVHMWVSLPTAR